MAVIVADKGSAERFVLLGTGYGAFESSRPDLFFGNLMPNEKSGSISVVAVCNADGEIGWVPPESVEVIEVDGKPLSEIL
jgi:hypothetical protein